MTIDLTKSEAQLIEEYLLKRPIGSSIKRGLSIVFDITYYCNLLCKGCAVNSKKHDSSFINTSDLELNKEQIFKILDKIKNHIDKNNINPFYLNFGGGEPFLRNDFKEILSYSCRLFGKKAIAVDTNGTILHVDDLFEIANYVSYIGISIDGLEEYHNNWRGNSRVDNPFMKSIELIKNAVKYDQIRDILEVSSVATKDNIEEISLLIELLNKMGVKYYSIHRTFPVGRMAKMKHLIPDAKDYLKLALIIAEADKELDIDCHFHHSLESIYGTILLGWNTYIADKVVGNPDSKSSFGIDPFGNIYFDPWCMVHPWNKLTGGNILEDTFDFNMLTSGEGLGILSIAKEYSLKKTRCNGCEFNCSGGSRIASSANYLYSIKKFELADLLIGLSKIDPACPMFSSSK